MGCQKCSKSIKEDMVIQQVYHPTEVEEGKSFTITVRTKSLASFFDYDARVCLYEGTTLIGDSGPFEIPAEKTYDVEFDITMPARDLDLRASLLHRGYVYDECEDYKDFTIKLCYQPNCTDKNGTPPSGSGINWLVIVIIAIVVIGVVIILRR